MNLPKYSIGTGDRFGHQGAAQLAAIMKGREDGLDLGIVWNKSHREHTIIGSVPADVKEAAKAAVDKLAYDGPWFMDADHIGLKNVELFMESSNFFTLDVADYVGEKAATEEIENFISDCQKYLGKITIPGIEKDINISATELERITETYLEAVIQAGAIYQLITEKKGIGTFITEVSMDETELPQTPAEIFIILFMIARQKIPAQTIAPKFSGRFNKGVDYVGEVKEFAQEFKEDLAVLEYAKKEFGLPESLKISIHSGSDKFSIYTPIQKILQESGAGIHIKTAGTTWLEELIGLAEADGVGLSIAKRIYIESLSRLEELCSPYSTVLDIDTTSLPAASEIESCTAEQYASRLRHELDCSSYNLHFRQLLHVGYKIAAEMGAEYTEALIKFSAIISTNVTNNLYERHIRRIFPVHSN